MIFENGRKMSESLDAKIDRSESQLFLIFVCVCFFCLSLIKVSGVLLRKSCVCVLFFSQCFVHSNFWEFLNPRDKRFFKEKLKTLVPSTTHWNSVSSFLFLSKKKKTDFSRILHRANNSLAIFGFKNKRKKQLFVPTLPGSVSHARVRW